MLLLFERCERIRNHMDRFFGLKPLREIFFEGSSIRGIGLWPLKNLIVMKVQFVVAHCSLPVDKVLQCLQGAFALHFDKTG
jgi:hypothetical protein